jgi:hypothetical protein
MSHGEGFLSLNFASTAQDSDRRAGEHDHDRAGKAFGPPKRALNWPECRLDWLPTVADASL